MKKSLPILAMLAMLFAACKTTKYTPEKFPIRQVVFGDGGGFTGIETSYTLLENGQLFKQVGVEGAYMELKAIKAKKAKEMFDKVNALQLFKLDIEKPGNMYYFLRQVTDHLDSRVTWGAGDYMPPQGVVVVYRELKEIAKTQQEAAAAKSTKQKSDKQPKTEGKKDEPTTKPKEENSGW
ncbi:MAG: hypothetical protein IT258_21835 [Saprospiraceae bacterium]|nr:hypothetical protein [Saprospiraceae bacterium]